MSVVQIVLKRKKVFDRETKEPGTVLLKGEILKGIQPVKLMNAIKLGEADIEVLEDKAPENAGSAGGKNKK